jgi:hypothetical protein
LGRDLFFEDFANIDPQVLNSYNKMLDKNNKDNIEDACLTFTHTKPIYGDKDKI